MKKTLRVASALAGMALCLGVSASPALAAGSPGPHPKPGHATAAGYGSRHHRKHHTKRHTAKDWTRHIKGSKQHSGTGAHAAGGYRHGHPVG